MKHVLKCFLHVATESWRMGEPAIYMADMSKTECMKVVLVKSLDIEVDIPDDFDPRPEQIASLKAQQTRAAADFHKLNTEIMRQINELQALEMAA